MLSREKQPSALLLTRPPSTGASTSWALPHSAAQLRRACLSPFRRAATMGIQSRILHCCSLMEVLGDLFIRVTGPCYVGMGMTLIACVGFLLVTVILPLTQDYRTPTGLVSLAATIWMLFNIVFNYVMSVRTRPGSPADHDVQVLCAEAGAGGPRRWCHRCRCAKPELTHHCRVCKTPRRPCRRRCVLKMDHHCPWINNCVGHHNYRYFFNFLAWLWLGCLVTVAASFRTVFRNAPEQLPVGFQAQTDLSDSGVPDNGGGGLGTAGGAGARHGGGIAEGMLRARAAGAGHALTEGQRGAALFSCVLAFSICMALCVLWWWHVYLVLTAQTTIDYYTFRERRQEAVKRGETYKNPYDLGPVKNWQEVFDETGRYWWITW